MIGDFSKATSNYTDSQPLGGIATGLSSSPAAPMSSGGLYQFNAANNSYSAKPVSQVNDGSLTNSYLNALKSQQGATAAAQSLSGVQTPNPNQPQQNQWTPEQQKAFQSFLGSMMGQPNGLNALNPTSLAAPNQPTTTTSPAPNPLVAGDNSRYANDPFKTNTNALR